MKPISQYHLSPQLLMPWHPGTTVSTNRAADMLGCCASTVIALIEDGTLQGFKLRPKVRNSHYRVIRNSVLELAERWRVECGAPESKDASGATDQKLRPSR